MFLTTNFIGSSSRVFRNYKNLIKEYFINFPYSDWPLNFEISLLGNIKYLNFSSFCYRIHDNSLTMNLLVDVNENIDKYNNRVNFLKKRYESYGKIL
jgi:hypothetical protein